MGRYIKYNKRRLRRVNSGVTLIEILISIAILVIVLLGLLSGYMGCMQLNERLRNTSIATEDARRVIEQMRSFSRISLSLITGTDWKIWGENNGCTMLPFEQVVVTYNDGDDLGIDPLDDDPLDVTVDITWQEKTRLRRVRIGSLITVW
ncbi:MAG: prepilin-type N-terminal cleavage/methylation domain-containing protein [Candidatus Omnitrophica bacterium]|nr:prepilin-type N-terminal cleavage/methylation domain-containing protein [Candidatus Omnitrophota bacterium]